MSSNLIIVGIVLYNPEINRLKENIDAVVRQAQQLVFINNGSKNINEILPIIPKDAVLINNEKNVGIATALNQILQYALDHDFEWAITLDQDSVVSDKLVATYQEKIKDSRLGMVCCEIKDRNAVLQREKDAKKEDCYVKVCITSASMLNVEAWRRIGGFDDSMFIDSVDFDICISLRKHGWKILKTYDTYILHEVGHSKVIKIFGKDYLSLNHSPFRYYYIVRNQIYLGRKYHFLSRNLLVTARTFWTVLRYEEQKKKKLARMVNGLIDGLICPITNPIAKKKNE